MIDEEEYFEYIKLINNKIPMSKNFQKISLSNRSQKEKLNTRQNLLNRKGFINIDDFVKQKRNGRNKFWKLYSVSVINKVTNDSFTAKMPILPIPRFTKEEISKIIIEVGILSALNHPLLIKFYGL